VNICFEVFLSVLMPPEVGMLMSCSLCEPESRADGALAAQELNQLINAVAEGPLPMQWQPRDSPISSNSTDYLARTTSARCFSNSRNYAGDSPPSGSGSYRRGRGRVGCADLAPANLDPLISNTNPPPFAIQQHVQPAPRRKLGRWPTSVTFVAGTFWPRGLIW
jgi:hypothetical protein